MAAFPQPSYRNDFEIAIICALQVESDAVEALFDEFWEDVDYGKAPGDTNAYTLGRIDRHNIVLVHMPGMGKARAAAVAASFRSSFPRIKLCLLVGICGGVPNGTDNEKEIVLGDVIISTGLVQYDFGRRFDHKFIQKDNLESHLGRPNAEIQSLLAKLGGRHSRLRLRKNTSSYLASLSQEGFENARYLGADEDKLFESTYRHKHHNLPTCNVCANCVKREDEVCDAALESSCVELKCDENRQVTRGRLVWAKEAPAGVGESHAAAQENMNAIKPSIHFGLMASGDTVMKSGEERDRIASKEKVIAFEMEGAGVWDTFPCVVIKGVCDYSDSHKNKKWQGYAAATAAACMKAFLKEWITSDRPSQLLLPPSELRLLAVLRFQISLRAKDLLKNDNLSSFSQRRVSEIKQASCYWQASI
jgi:nucleoside phosphorylase